MKMSAENKMPSVEKGMDILSMIDKGVSNFVLKCSSIILLAERLKNIETAHLKRLEAMPYHINVINMAARGKLRETAHSAILQRLLKNQAILDSFVKNIVGLDICPCTPDNVRDLEVDRMDVSIYSPGVCIIIENKVNNAEEQPGQIYRYVNMAKNGSYTNEEIIVVYLNPDHYGRPTDFSLTEEGKGVNRIPPKIERNLIIKNYSHDIYTWVKSLREKINNKEEFLSSALHQYQDYLENLFYLTDKYKEMREEMHKVIEERLKGAASLDDRISRLQNMQENIEILKGQIDVLLKASKADQRAANLAIEFGGEATDMTSLYHFGYNEAEGIGMPLKKDGQTFVVSYGEDSNKSWLGIASCSNRFDGEFVSNLREAFVVLGLNPKVNSNYDKWLQWAYLSDQNDWKKQFKALIEQCKTLADK